MKKIIPVFFLLLIISFAGFIFFLKQPPVTFREARAAGKFSISVPDYLAESDTLDPSALLQYHNEKENILLLVYEGSDTLRGSLQEVFKDLAGDLVSHIEHGAVVKYYNEKINGQDAFIGNIRGSVDRTKVYYRMAVIGAPSGYWEVLFGVGDGEQSRYAEDMDVVIHSLKQEKD